MKLVLIGFLVALIFAGVIYLTIQNIISTIIIFLLTISFFVLFVRREINKYQNKIHRYHQCYQFINTFLISLSIRQSLGAAITSAYEIMDKDSKEVLDAIKEMNEQEKLSYLKNYFCFDIYHLFLDVITLWNEEGGNILLMSKNLIDQTRLKEQYLIFAQNTNRAKVIEFIVLWSISLTILCSLRFALSQFYETIKQTIVYQGSVVFIFVFILLSLYMMVKKIANIQLEGWKENEY